MRSNIFIPQKINVGFQKRDSTYTGKLAYIIYFDEKGKLRKENSWNSWRDEKIDNIIYNNDPMSGFVLNKKVGDYVSDWNHRQAYVRVYDPRGFEFEITIENLLYILENASSIKGKGLEGEFIYGWDGKDLILIPCESPDYKQLVEFNEKLHSDNKINAKDLKIGATYRFRDNSEWIYLGRFDKWDYKYKTIQTKYIDDDRWCSSNQYFTHSIKTDINKGKHYFFGKMDKSYRDEDYLNLNILKSISGKIIDIISEECVENYAELFDLLEGNRQYSPVDETKDEYVNYTLDELKSWFEDYKWGKHSFYNHNKEYSIIQYKEDGWNNYTREYKNIYCKANNKKYDTLEEVYEDLKPMYKNVYLKTGKFYEKE